MSLKDFLIPYLGKPVAVPVFYPFKKPLRCKVNGETMWMRHFDEKRKAIVVSREKETDSDLKDIKLANPKISITPRISVQ